MIKKYVRRPEGPPSCIPGLLNLGISYDDAHILRRAAMTLHRWYERECNGEVERDEETGKTYTVCSWGALPGAFGKRYPVPDRETGARRRVLEVISRYPGLIEYHQTDPRGAPLYIIPLKALAGRDADACYSSCGVAVYK